MVNVVLTRICEVLGLFVVFAEFSQFYHVESDSLVVYSTAFELSGADLPS
jgi:hypothetical protein